MSLNERIIWLIEERTFGTLVNMGAYVSEVKFTHGGIDYDTIVENDEFVIIADYESESDEDD